MSWEESYHTSPDDMDDWPDRALPGFFGCTYARDGRTYPELTRRGRLWAARVIFLWPARTSLGSPFFLEDPESSDDMDD